MKIIAEIGLNHCGSLDRAQKLLNGVLNTSVDGLTFQIREKEFYDRSHPRKRELTDDFYKQAIKLANSNNKQFGLAISQVERVQAFNKMGVDFWKTLSWDINNLNLHRLLQMTNKKVYVSTGISNMENIIFISKKIENIEFIHTQLDYSLEKVNLKAIKSIRNNTGKPVGFGLHSPEHFILFAAISFEPSILFFYVKDNSDKEHPDDEHAIKLNDLEDYVINCKKLLHCIGDGKKNAINNTLHPDDDDITK